MFMEGNAPVSVLVVSTLKSGGIHMELLLITQSGAGCYNNKFGSHMYVFVSKQSVAGLHLMS